MKNKKFITCNRLIPLILLFVISAAFSSESYAQISVIVSKASSQKLTDSQIKNVFMGNMLSWSDGSKIVVVDQPESATGKDFYSKFVGESVSKVRVKWTKLVLSGQAAAPVKADGDDAVKNAVASDDNAIGYISSSKVDGTVKEIFKIE